MMRDACRVSSRVVRDLPIKCKFRLAMSSLGSGPPDPMRKHHFIHGFKWISSFGMSVRLKGLSSFTVVDDGIHYKLFLS